jgi:hypothetical protein
MQAQLQSRRPGRRDDVRFDPAQEGRHMRIALVISALGAGGAERVIVTLAKAWAARGWHVALITFEAAGNRALLSGRPAGGAAPAGHPVERPPAVAGDPPGSAPGARTASGPAHGGSRPGDLVPRQINVLTVLASRGLALPVVVSERNNPERQRCRGTWTWLRQRLYGIAWCVVTPSRGVLASFPSKIRARGRVIPNPVALTGRTSANSPKSRRISRCGAISVPSG